MTVCKAWKNEYGSIHRAPGWVWEAIVVKQILRDTPTSGDLYIRASGEVCEPGQHLYNDGNGNLSVTERFDLDVGAGL